MNDNSNDAFNVAFNRDVIIANVTIDANTTIVFMCDDTNACVTLRANNDNDRSLLHRAHIFARHRMFHASFIDEVLTIKCFDDDNDVDALIIEMRDALNDCNDAFIARCCDNDDARIASMRQCRDAFATCMQRMSRDRIRTT